MRKALFAAAVLSLVAGFLLAASHYRKKRAESLGFLAEKNSELFVRPHSPVLGDAGAKVYLVKFTDPACETCAAFSGFVKQGLAAFPGRIKLVIRYAPFHEGADDIVRVLEAARRQGKYWETLDVLYATQAHWTRHHRVQLSRAWEVLPRAGVDVERIRRDMGDPEFTRIIEQDLSDARALGVNRTPGFFVNGKGLQDFGAVELRQLILEELVAKYPGLAAGQSSSR